MKGFKKEELQSKFKEFYWNHHDKKMKAFSIAENIINGMDDKYKNNLTMSFAFSVNMAYVRVNYFKINKMITMNMEGYILLKGKLSPEEVQSIRDTVKIHEVDI